MLERSSLHFLVHCLGELEALLQVGVLHQIHKYVGLRIVRVEAFIAGGVVVLKLYD